jgi:NCAIR mutase (PurE)-related protein
LDPSALKDLLEKVYNQSIAPGEAMGFLKNLPFEDMGFAQVDHHRSLRTGLPEVIYCQGKTVDQVVAVMESLLKNGQDVLATRADPQMYEAVKRLDSRAEYNPNGRTIVIRVTQKKPTKGIALILTAGTSDIPVAEEALETAGLLGSAVEALYDVGVAGIHRLLGRKETLERARVIVVVAGMDGALASVVGGMVDKPVIAVPTSVGYGASFGGIAALLTMLNSCAAGVATVNIDNGFGAGCMAHKINMLGEDK